MLTLIYSNFVKNIFVIFLLIFYCATQIEIKSMFLVQNLIYFCRHISTSTIPLTQTQ